MDSTCSATYTRRCDGFIIIVVMIVNDIIIIIVMIANDITIIVMINTILIIIPAVKAERVRRYKHVRGFKVSLYQALSTSKAISKS